MSTQMGADVGPLFTGLCDDAAIFPPGNLPLEQAVPAHLRHLRGAHAGVVGPLVLAAQDLSRLVHVVADLGADVEEPFALAVTVPLPKVADAVAGADRIPAVRPTVLEVALPRETLPGDVVPALDAALAATSAEGTGVTVFVEVPRDERRKAMLVALSGTAYLAKFRTGGVTGDLYPDDAELADTVLAAVRAGVAFKATAGLHHALRNTDPATGFEQHGFLNLLAATAAALDGGDRAELVALLADRDGARVSARAGALSPQVREAFRSFGTCSIADPVEELAGLGLLDPHLTEDLS